MAPAVGSRRAARIGAPFVHESIIGTRFTGRLRRGGDRRRPARGRPGDHRARLDHRRWASTCSTPTTRSPKASGSSGPDAIVVGAGICGASAAFYLQRARARRAAARPRRGARRDDRAGRGQRARRPTSEPGPGARPGRCSAARCGASSASASRGARVTRKGALVLGHAGEAGGSARSSPRWPPGMPRRPRARRPAGRPARADRARWRRWCRCARAPRSCRSSARRGRAARRRAPGLRARRGGDRAVGGRLTGLPVEPRKGQLVALGRAARPDPATSSSRRRTWTRSPARPGADRRQRDRADARRRRGARRLQPRARRLRPDRRADEVTRRACVERAARCVPALRELPVTRAWCGFRALAARRPAGDRRAAVTACGRRRATRASGVGLGPVSGRLLAQLICGETPELDPAPFDPRRFAAAGRRSRIAASRLSGRSGRGRRGAPRGRALAQRGAQRRAQRRRALRVHDAAQPELLAPRPGGGRRGRRCAARRSARPRRSTPAAPSRRRRASRRERRRRPRAPRRGRRRARRSARRRRR